MPKDKDGKFYIFPPVEPESVGFMLILYILWQFGPYILAGLVIFGILFGILSFVGSIFFGATQFIEQQQIHAAQAVEQANIQNGLTEFNKLRYGSQALYLEYQIGDSQTCNDYMDIHTLEFANDGVWLYFDASIINTNNDISGAWLTWKPDQFNLNDGVNGIQPQFAQIFKSLPDTQCDSLKVEHYTGFLIYPYSKIFDQNVGNGILYFARGGDSEYIHSLYPLIDLRHPENWNIIPALHSDYKMGISTQELGENGNSNLILMNIEANDNKNWLTLSLVIAVNPNTTDNFVLKQPNQVYILANSRQFPASRWNGVFDRYGDSYIYELGWYTSPWSRQGAIQFDNAWSEIKSTGCFDFYYGDSYTFQNICIR